MPEFVIVDSFRLGLSRRYPRGLTLIEVMIAMLIFAVGIVAVASHANQRPAQYDDGAPAT